MKMKLALGCLLLVSTAVAQQQGTARPDGSICGIAISRDGQFAKEIGLTAVPLGVPLGNVLPHATTNDHGEYRFVNLPWWGRYTVYAEDEEAGYSSFSTGNSNQTQPPAVEITPAHREGKLKVNLPPKAAFLRVHLTNEKTGAPIPGMSIMVMRGTHPPSLAFSMSCFSTKIVLLPPDKDLFVHITSDGFREWKGSTGKGKMLHLTSGSRLTLDVELEPHRLSRATYYLGGRSISC